MSITDIVGPAPAFTLDSSPPPPPPATAAAGPMGFGASSGVVGTCIGHVAATFSLYVFRL